MASVTGKRKRAEDPRTASKTRKVAAGPAVNGTRNPRLKKISGDAKHAEAVAEAADDVAARLPSPELHVQIVTGSYERVLHGFCASIPQRLLQTTTAESATGDDDDITFSDTFLFAAHLSSVRCLAVSPLTEADKRYLATGGSDERINVYSVSTAAPTSSSKGAKPSLTGVSITENPRNRSLGSLIHHDRAITCLRFPAKGKLFSAAEDNTIAISRTRDWTVLSSIKAPIPKAQGRPSGDTAGPGETPAGVNDFAIHPSQKLMLSVGRGERCVRLWNLMTGKKAGVLNFDRGLLTQVGEGKYSSGEGRRLLWNEAGEAYVVGFERGAAVFGIDSEPKAVIRPSPVTKFHQMHFVPSGEGSDSANVLAASTEDGRILFFDTTASANDKTSGKLPPCNCLAQVGGSAAGTSGRIKDFELIALPSPAGAQASLLLVTASSDGTVRLWTISASELAPSGEAAHPDSSGTSAKVKQVGRLIGSLETGNRITCLGAFILDGKVSSEADAVQEDAQLEAQDGESEESE